MSSSEYYLSSVKTGSKYSGKVTLGINAFLTKRKYYNKEISQNNKFYFEFHIF
jgi:hypothetical protein